MHVLSKKVYSISLKVLVSSLFCSLLIMPLYSSDLSEARGLRGKCEKEIKLLEIAAMNFGDAGDKAEFAKGTKLIKMGKVKFIQSKFPAAIKNYKDYLKLQHGLYGSLAKKYIARTSKMNDAIAEDVVDFIDQKKVEQYLRLANQNFQDAKSLMNTKHYKRSISHCRKAKAYALGAYKLINKPIPPQYTVDSVDNDKKIFKK